MCFIATGNFTKLFGYSTPFLKGVGRRLLSALWEKLILPRKAIMAAKRPFVGGSDTEDHSPRQELLRTIKQWNTGEL